MLDKSAQQRLLSTGERERTNTVGCTIHLHARLWDLAAIRRCSRSRKQALKIIITAQGEDDSVSERLAHFHPNMEVFALVVDSNT